MQIVANNLRQLHWKIDQKSNKLKFPLLGNFEYGSIRTLKQNSLQHKHYAEIAKATNDFPLRVKCLCKLEYGLPLILHRIPVLEIVYTIPGLDDRLDFIKHVNVTSLFEKLEARDYTQEIMHNYSCQGIILTDPDDQLLEEWQKVYEQLKSKGEL